MELRTKKPNPIVVVLLTTFLPGLGFYYAGVGFRRAFGIYIGVGLWFNFFSFFLDRMEPWKPAFVINLACILLTAIALCVLAIRVARKFDAAHATKRHYVKFIFMTLAFAFTLAGSRLYFGIDVRKNFHVPATSMEPTIKVGDRVRVNLLAFSRNKPQVGDLVVFAYPKDPSINYIKRVAALGGDKIRIVADVVYLNGAAQLQEPASGSDKELKDNGDDINTKILFREHLGVVDHFAFQNLSEMRPIARSTWPKDEVDFEVPKDSIFVLGDNRDNSYDSRNFGAVSLELLVGRVEGVVYSIGPNFQIRWSRLLQDLN